MSESLSFSVVFDHLITSYPSLYAEGGALNSQTSDSQYLVIESRMLSFIPDDRDETSNPQALKVEHARRATSVSRPCQLLASALSHIF